MEAELGATHQEIPAITDSIIHMQQRRVWTNDRHFGVKIKLATQKAASTYR